MSGHTTCGASHIIYSLHYEEDTRPVILMYAGWQLCMACLESVLSVFTRTSRFLLGKTNDGLIDCHSSQAIRCKPAKQVEYFTWVYASFHPTHSDNAANVILLKKSIDAYHS